MTAHDETQYRSLLQEIERYSPRTSAWLAQIYKNYGIQAGCYASVAIVWLHARIEYYGESTFKGLTEKDVQSFTYYQEMKRDPEALALFRNMLQVYLVECQIDDRAIAEGECVEDYYANHGDENEFRF